jgi:hypothetical protein
MLLVKLINKNVEGVFNIGTDKKTIYELASQTKKVEKILSPEKTPKNVTMDLNKLLNFVYLQYD